ncbi:MAG: histidine phosphatase family protein [Candidatus Dormibacteraeota bacterium]|nr:histidine phosphatase family protein [Candidatus Dormibacteraeota bacterium]
MASRILFVRHGQSTWNAEHRVQGQADPPLSERGREQAARLAARLKGRRVAALYSSDLLRARETAAPLERAFGCEATLDAGLREIALGEWEGLTGAEIEAAYPDLWRAWTRHPDWDLVPGGERAAAFQARVRQAVALILAHHAGQEVVCVTHGGVIQSTLGDLVGRATDGVFPFVIANTSLTSIRSLGGRTVVTRVNDTCHLS